MKSLRNKWTEEAVERIFEEPPVLIEVQFRRMGTSPDWYLFESIEEFEELAGRLHGGVELVLTSVWKIDSLPESHRIRLKK